MGDHTSPPGNGNGDASDDLMVGDTVVGMADVYGDTRCPPICRVRPMTTTTNRGGTRSSGEVGRLP